MSPSSVHTLRLLALIEGVSFLFLLGVAMPLKYMAGMPLPVKIAGWVHGLLFIALCYVLFTVTIEKRWPLLRSGMVFLAALLPFGPFVIDRRLKQYE